MMVHLSYLQAFADVNKRTSRLAANLPLLRANLCPLTFIDVPESAYSRAVLGIYELTRIELLRDVYLWAYERSAQEYHVIRQGLTPPDPLRIKYRALIKTTIFEVVTRTEIDPIEYITHIIDSEVEPGDQENVRFLIMDSLRLLHEGVLARYGLRPSQLAAWKARQR